MTHTTCTGPLHDFADWLSQQPGNAAAEALGLVSGMIGQTFRASEATLSGFTLASSLMILGHFQSGELIARTTAAPDRFEPGGGAEEEVARHVHACITGLLLAPFVAFDCIRVSRALGALSALGDADQHEAREDMPSAVQREAFDHAHNMISEMMVVGQDLGLLIDAAQLAAEEGGCSQ